MELAADEETVKGVRTAQRKNREAKETIQQQQAELCVLKEALKQKDEQIRVLDALLFDGAEAASEAEQRAQQLLHENKELKARFDGFLDTGEERVCASQTTDLERVVQPSAAPGHVATLTALPVCTWR
jgi:hypothetical protein